jgi:ornithine decarboxylase
MSPARVERLQCLWLFNLPSITPHYAVKCNPDPKLIGLLRQYGFGFDCASQRELSLMNTNDLVVYANPCKSERDIAYAKERGSPLTVIDSCEEVEKLDQASYKGGALVRIKVDDTGSKMPFGAKFGADVDAVAKIAEYAKKKNIGLQGISFHVGSESANPDAHKKAIELAVTQCEKLLSAGHMATIIDIGGGFVADKNLFTLQAAGIRGAVHAKRKAGLRFIAEPGRFFATESQDLFVQVIGKKPAGGMRDGWRYTLDESLYGQFTNILFDHQEPRWVRIPQKEGAVGKKSSGILFGRTCDSLDVIARSDDMEELEVGDWLWFPHMGAYTTVTASEFNGFPKPPVFLDEHNELPLKSSVNMSSSVGKIQYVKAVSAKEMLA